MRCEQRCEQRDCVRQPNAVCVTPRFALRWMDVLSIGIYSATLILTHLSLAAGGEVEIEDIDTVIGTAHAKDMAVRRSLITLHRLRRSAGRG